MKYFKTEPRRGSNCHSTKVDVRLDTVVAMWGWDGFKIAFCTYNIQEQTKIL